MTTCPRCGMQHNRELNPRGRPGGNADCTTWWCPRGHRWSAMPAARAPSMVLRENKRHERLVFPGLFVLPRLPSFPPVFPDVAACPSAAALVHDQPATFARRDAAKLAALVDLYDDNGEAIPAVPAVATPASPAAIRYAGPIKARNAAQAPTEHPCLLAADIAEWRETWGRA